MKEGVLVAVSGESESRSLARSLLGDEHRASIGDEPGVGYTVRETSELVPDDLDPDDAPLQLSSIEVRSVTGVRFDTSPSTVRREEAPEEASGDSG